MAGTTTFSIDLDATGRGSVVIGEQDVSHVVDGLQVNARHGDLPQVVLYARHGGGRIEGEGIVEVHRDVTGGDAVRTLDPEQVRAMVAERCTGMADDTYDAMLQAVADLLDAQAAG